MKARIVKTVVLGVIALIALCWSMFRFWDVPPEDIVAVVLGGAMVTAAVAVLAFFCVVTFYLLRKLFRRNSAKNRYSTYLENEDANK